MNHIAIAIIIIIIIIIIIVRKPQGRCKYGTHSRGIGLMDKQS